MDYNKEKTSIYKIFISFSVLICIFLLPFVYFLISNFSAIYPGDESSSAVIPVKIANSVATYVWPILILYLTMFVILIIKKINYRKVYFPLSLFTLIIILANLGIIYFGFNVLWIFIGLSFPLIALLVVSGIIGYKLDNNSLTIKKAGKILVLALLIMIVYPMLIFIGNKIDNSISNYKYEKIEEYKNNSHKKMIEEIKEEFNNLIDSDFIVINDFKLNSNNELSKMTFLILNDNMPNDEMTFCNELITSYNNIKNLLSDYKYPYGSIHFTFTDENTFLKDPASLYNDRGYIRYDWDNEYLIYLNPIPIKINK